MVSANNLLNIEDLHVHYGSGKNLVRAVDGVDLKIAPGEVLGLVGESGCGKSSLGRALLGLEEVTSGKISFQGSDCTGLRGRKLKQFRQRAQMVFQDPYGSLNPRMTIGVAIEEVLAIHRILKGRAARRQRVREILMDVGLRPEYAQRYPHEFSGGERQRVGLARALVLNPSLLVADEPVSALDVSIQHSVLNLLQRLRKEHGLAYLFISHDLAVVRRISDRIAVMYEGQIVEKGSAEEICDRPQHPYTHQLLDAVPDIDSILAEREEERV